MRLEKLLAVFCVAGCTTVPTLTPSELNAHAAMYDGKEVHVRGWLVYQFEDQGLWDSKDAHDELRRRVQRNEVRDPPYFETCVSYSGPGLGRRLKSQYVVLDGIFWKNTDPPGSYIIGVCNAAVLETKRLPAGWRL